MRGVLSLSVTEVRSTAIRKTVWILGHQNRAPKKWLRIKRGDIWKSEETVEITRQKAAGHRRVGDALGVGVASGEGEEHAGGDRAAAAVELINPVHAAVDDPNGELWGTVITLSK